tara:strand:+ start:35265 stop:35747 length:483 start_codon:yes stop_codon:yes gene_type:complete
MHYKSMNEVESLVCAFEEQTTSLEEWDHQMHLAVCCWYVMKTPEKAEPLMRNGLKALNKNLQSTNRTLGVIATPSNEYHETLTLFWIAKVRSLVEVCSGPDIVVLNAVIRGLADPSLVYFHYSHENIDSSEARASWREPDLHRLPVEGTEQWEWPERRAS